MSFAYVAGTSTGSDDVYDAMYTALNSQGWSIRDALSTREAVWQSAELATGTGYKLYFYIKSDSNQVLDYIIYNDWDIGTHTGIQAANSYGNPRIIPWTGGPYRIRANPYSIAMYTDNPAFHDQLGYIGLYQRALSSKLAGFSPIIGALTAGAVSLPTAISLVGLVQVGQQLLLWNWAHNLSSGNALNREIVTVTSVSSGAVGISALANNYDAGAILGQGTLLCTGWGDGVNTASSYPTNGIVPMGPDGFSSSSTVGAITTSSSPNFNSGTPAAITAGLTLYPTVNCPIFVGTGKATTLGNAHHMIAITTPLSVNNAQFTKYTDGVNVYEQMNQGPPSGSSANVAFGPTGDVPNFSTMLMINSPFPPPNDVLLVDPIPVPPAPSGAVATCGFNQGFN